MNPQIKTSRECNDKIEDYISSLSRHVDIYIVKDADITSDDVISTYLPFMSDEERARGGRFHFERDRWQFVIGRILMRTTLSRYMPSVEPQTWQFTAGQFGRPAVQNTDRLHFNLAHTQGTIVLAVANTPLIGVDVENCQRPLNIEEIAARHFCHSEYEALMASPVASRRQTFFDLWTLKEAYVKACGAGLTIPFTDVCFEFQGDTGVSLSFAPARLEDPSRWRLWCLNPDPVTTLSVSVADHHDDVALRLLQGIPLVGFDSIPAQFRRVHRPPPRCSSEPHQAVHDLYVAV